MRYDASNPCLGQLVGMWREEAHALARVLRSWHVPHSIGARRAWRTDRPGGWEWWLRAPPWVLSLVVGCAGADPKHPANELDIHLGIVFAGDAPPDPDALDVAFRLGGYAALEAMISDPRTLAYTFSFDPANTIQETPI